MAKEKSKPLDPNTFAKTFFEDLLANLALDPEKTSGRGIEFNFLPYGTLLINHSGAGNKAYMRGLKRLADEHGEDLKNMSEERQSEILARLYAETVIVGLVTPDGQDVPYTKSVQDMCAKAFAEPSMASMFAKLQTAAADEANFRRKKQDAQAKNSKRS